MFTRMWCYCTDLAEYVAVHVTVEAGFVDEANVSLPVGRDPQDATFVAMRTALNFAMAVGVTSLALKTLSQYMGDSGRKSTDCFVSMRAACEAIVTGRV